MGEKQPQEFTACISGGPGHRDLDRHTHDYAIGGMYIPTHEENLR
jgi:hypothetical protein